MVLFKRFPSFARRTLASGVGRLRTRNVLAGVSCLRRFFGLHFLGLFRLGGRLGGGLVAGVLRFCGELVAGGLRLCGGLVATGLHEQIGGKFVHERA